MKSKLDLKKKVLCSLLAASTMGIFLQQRRFGGKCKWRKS